MKKQTILAFTTALGIAMSVSAPVEAASANRVNISVYEKDCTRRADTGYIRKT